MNKDKLYQVGFFAAYGKEARPGWFWREFGMAFDRNLRDAVSRITADYQKVVKIRDVGFSDYLDEVWRLERDRWLGAVVLTEAEEVAKIQEQYGFVSVDTDDRKTLILTIRAENDVFDDAVAAGMATAYQYFTDGEKQYAGETEYGSFEFNVTDPQRKK